MKHRRYSKQRELIYSSLQARYDHPSAEMLYQSLKAEQPALSLGTVYRNLNQLAEDGLALRMPFNADRYDANTTEHPHFYCTTCQQLSDLALPLNAALDEMVSAQGYQVQRHDLVFRGICRTCTDHAGNTQS